jgi:HD superfamily phosphohydrolase YqeK
MPANKYQVYLTDEEKFELEALVHKSKSAAHSQTRARILLKAAAGVQDKDIIQALESLLPWWRKPANVAWKKGLKPP